MAGDLPGGREEAGVEGVPVPEHLDWLGMDVAGNNGAYGYFARI